MYVWNLSKKQLCDVVRNLSREFEIIFIFVICCTVIHVGILRFHVMFAGIFRR